MRRGAARCLHLLLQARWQAVCTVLKLMCHSFHRFAFKHNLYRLREERDMKPSTFGELVSSTLYEKR